MSTLKSFLVAAVTVSLAACGGAGGAVDSAAASEGDALLRLASETATVKPWDSTAESTVLEIASLAVAPLKTASTVQGSGTVTISGSASTGVTSVAVSAYDPTALPIMGGEASASALWPSWRQPMARWQWKQIPATDLSSVAPSPRVPGALSARIDAWNGLAADTATNRLFSAANGGHADYAGNEVYQIDLSKDSPSWEILRAPSEPADIQASDYTRGVFADYYLDGRPASTHTYYALNFIASRNAIFKFGAGSLWGSGNEANWKTDAFSLDTSDWHPSGTWPDAIPGSRVGVTAASVCKHPTTEQVYVATPGNLRRFDPESGTFAVLATWPMNSSAVYARGCAVDPVRNRVVFFGDAYRAPNGGLMYDVASGSFNRISFVGEFAGVVAQRSHHFAWYEPKIGQFLMKTNTGGQVFAIDPETFVVQVVATLAAENMPDAANGVHTRWQRLPNLGGYAYYPRNGSGVWFLAIE